MMFTNKRYIHLTPARLWREKCLPTGQAGMQIDIDITPVYKWKTLPKERKQ